MAGFFSTKLSKYFDITNCLYKFVLMILYESNFAYTQDENVTIIHHSTSSLISIEVNSDEGKRELYMDYSEFDSLIRALDRIKVKS